MTPPRLRVRGGRLSAKEELRRNLDDASFRHSRRRFLTDKEALNRIQRTFDGADASVGDAIEEIARLVRLTGRKLTHDNTVDTEEEAP